MTAPNPPKVRDRDVVPGFRWGTRIVTKRDGSCVDVICDCGRPGRVRVDFIVKRGWAKTCPRCSREAGLTGRPNKIPNTPWEEDVEAQVALSITLERHGRGMTLDEIARFESLSRERINQIERKALRKLYEVARRDPALRDLHEWLKDRLATEPADDDKGADTWRAA
jgi:hypothetical protein